MVFIFFKSYYSIIAPLISLVLMLVGYRKQWRHINFKEPLGRSFFITLNTVAIGLFWSGYYVLGRINKGFIVESLATYLIIAYILGIGGILFFFMAGMRRLSAIGELPSWVYPVVVILGVALSNYVPMTIEILGLFHIYLFIASSSKYDNSKR